MAVIGKVVFFDICKIIVDGVGCWICLRPYLSKISVNILAKDLLSKKCQYNKSIVHNDIIPSISDLTVDNAP